MRKFRVAAYNVQNLFSRPRLFAAGDDQGASSALRNAAVLQRLLDAKVYDRDQIVRVFNEGRLGQYLAVRCDRVNAPDARSQRFFFHERDGDDASPVVSVNDAVRGRADWAGGIALTAETLSGAQVQAIAKVIRRVDADVIALCEVEDRATLEQFNAQHLGRKYPYCILIEGNDERGIDVAVMSKHPPGAMRTNVFTTDPTKGKRRDGAMPRLFNRDCLEVEIMLPGGGAISVLATHLKSKRGSAGSEADTDPTRILQSEEIARIVRQRYLQNGKPCRVIVAGDLNETPDRNGRNGVALGARKTSIDALLIDAGLSNVVGDTLGVDKAYTHIEDRAGRIARGQIDYLLLSPDLRAATVSCGIDRSGQSLWGPKAPAPALAASDHACLFVDLDLDRLT